MKNQTHQADVKTLRDKLNGSIPLLEGETEDLIREQWDRLHEYLEALKEHDERNYSEFD